MLLANFMFDRLRLGGYELGHVNDIMPMQYGKTPYSKKYSKRLFSWGWKSEIKQAKVRAVSEAGRGGRPPQALKNKFKIWAPKYKIKGPLCKISIRKR